MAGNKYIKNSAGVLTEEAAIQTSAGAGDAGKIPALDAAGRLNVNMMPTGIGADTASIVTSENLAAGDLVNLYDNAGTVTARKADAATNKPAVGYVLAGTTSPAAATVYFEGQNNQMSGLVGGDQYLSVTVPGRTQAAAPTAAGHIVQVVGFATAATTLNFQSRAPITLA